MRAIAAKPLFGRATALASLMVLLPVLLPVAALAASPVLSPPPTLPVPPLSPASPAVRSSAASRPVAGGAAGLSPAAIGAARALVANAFDQLETAARSWRQTAPAAWQPILEEDAAALGDGLGALDAALAAANPGYLAILGDADRDLVALQLAWRRAQAAAPPGAARRSEPVVRALDNLAEAMSQLVGAYGAAARRAARGGPMSVGESSSFIRLNQAAASLQARLPALAAAARSHGDAALAAALASLQEALQQVAAAPPTLAGYLVALQAGGYAVALWNGSAPFLSAAEQGAWQQAESAAGDLTTAAETGFVFTTDFASGATSSFAAAAPSNNTSGGGPAAGGAGVGSADDDTDGAWGASAADPMSRGAFPDTATPVAAAEAADAAAVAAGGGSVGVRPGAAVANAIPADPAASTGGFASLDGAAAAPALPPGANPPAGSAEPDRIVIHGGAAGIAEAAAAGIDISGGSAPAFSFELGDLSGEAMSAALAANAEDEAPSTFDPDADAGIHEPPGPLAWEPLCRPWQPPLGGYDLCLAPSAAHQ
jgi:hypothetical protein